MSNTDQNTPARKSHNIARWQAVLLELVLGVHCGLLVAGGFILFDSHSRPALISFAAGAVAGLAGFAVHYRHINRNNRTIAWRFFAPLTGLYVLMLAGVGLTWSEWTGDPLKPLIDGLSGAMVTGKGLGDNLSALAVIALWGAFGVYFAVRGFSWEQSRD